MKQGLTRACLLILALVMVFMTGCTARKNKTLSIYRTVTENFDISSVTEEMYYGKGEMEPDDFVFSGGVLLVGVSTVCQQYCEWRFERQDLMGWGRYLELYLIPETFEAGKQGTTVSNMALSGGSSLSFLKSANYKALENSLGAGDYLFIQFGHNDQKASVTEGTSPTLSRFEVSEFGMDEEGRYSFEWVIYEKYIKLAMDRGAVPVLVTPPVRLNLETGAPNVGGAEPYREVLLSLAEEFSLPLVDLTTLTREAYETRMAEEGTDANFFLHAYSDVERTQIDDSHLSRYGAFYLAGLVSEAVSELPISLSEFVIESNRDIRPRNVN